MGVAGSGKRAFARSLAAALWCRRLDADGIACGACEDCRQVASEAHSGYHLLRVEEDASTIKIEAVRVLTEKLQMTTHDGRAKVAIIEPVDALNNAGINALLKTIEEPSPRSHLILIAEHPRALPATLRSRCQQLRFGTPSRAEALDWLRAARGADEPATKLAAALDSAGGAPLRALELMDGKQLALEAEWQRGLLALAAGRAEPVTLAATIGDNTAGFVYWLYGWLAGLLRSRAEPQNGGDAEVGMLARRLPPALLDAYIAEVQPCFQRVTTTANKTLLVESLLIGWVGLVARASRAAQNPVQ
jgi:DNA polymerase-3 subunit delta'